MRTAERSNDPPQDIPIDPERDERFRPQLEPYLRALDDAMSHEDAAQARDAIEALWPALCARAVVGFRFERPCSRSLGASASRFIRRGRWSTRTRSTCSAKHSTT
jgi:hypothetical protein